MIAYHDDEWGTLIHGERELFEFLVLEGAQAGLSWETILNKRAGYRKAFDGFDVGRVAAYDDGDVARLLADDAIVRNRLKVVSAITNARAALALRETDGGLDAYFESWRAAARDEHRPPRDASAIPVDTPVSSALSRDLKKRGFAFVGPIVMYSFMQATGFINDHTAGCYRAEKRHKRKTSEG